MLCALSFEFELLEQFLLYREKGDTLYEALD